ncbi:hypothetical protein L345_07541, partial [Ophiophagus hannah]
MPGVKLKQDTVLKPPKLEEEAFEIKRVKIPLDIKQEIDGEANSPANRILCSILESGEVPASCITTAFPQK